MFRLYEQATSYAGNALAKEQLSEVMGLDRKIFELETIEKAYTNPEAMMKSKLAAYKAIQAEVDSSKNADQVSGDALPIILNGIITEAEWKLLPVSERRQLLLRVLSESASIKMRAVDDLYPASFRDIAAKNMGNVSLANALKKNAP